MFNKIFLVLTVIVLTLNVGLSQKNKADIGVFLGGSSYMGDLNVENPFRQIRPAIAGFYRYNIHSRIALRGDLSYNRVVGSDSKSNFEYQKIRNLSFSTDIIEVAGLVEINFLTFKQEPRQNYFSPYAVFGLGVMMIDFSFQPKIIENLSIPFGFGVKMGLTQHIAIGIEYTLHKTFYDRIDKISNWLYTSGEKYPLKQKAWLENNDWFTFFGVFISYKLKSCVSCSANKN